MGVANTFTFGGISTSTYGLVVEGSGDYSAPKRAVESVEIPGRNGAFQLDKGYYENIEIEYKVVVTSDNHSSFLTSIDNFRNAIVSKIGYQRLEDTYHPNEYRMAAYAGGLDEAPTFIGKNAVFKVKFDCKPQRFLTSGETAVAVASGGTVTNPTLFEASPLLAVKGYGNIEFNGYEIELRNEAVGNIELLPAVTNSTATSRNYAESDANLLNNGDTMTLGNFTLAAILNPSKAYGYKKLEILGVAFNGSHGISNYISNASQTAVSDYKPAWSFSYGEQTFTKTSGTTQYTDSVTFSLRVTKNDNTTVTGHADANLRCWNRNSGSYNWLQIGFFDVVLDNSLKTYFSNLTISIQLTAPAFIGDSSQSVLGNPTYIDCDFGEAYKLVSGEPAALNQFIDLGSILPTLAPGSNTITYDNTITELKVTPRWWKV